MSPISGVWEHFKKVENDSKVQCLRCNARLAYKNTTSNLISHLKTHGIKINVLPAKGGKRKRFRAGGDNSGDADRSNEEDEAEIPPTNHVRDEAGAASSRSSSTEAGTSQCRSSSIASVCTGPLDKCINNYSSFAPGGARDVQCTNALLYMVCKDNLPLNTPEHVGFRKFAQTLQPLFKIPSEPSLTRWMEDKYSYSKNEVIKMLKDADHIVLTMDLWTQSYTMRAHLGVTVHFTKGAVTRSVELGTQVCDERKTTANLTVKIREFVDDWNIDRRKVRAVLTDGGANIKAAVKAEFGDAKHISCFAHRLNLIGQKVIGNSGTVPSEEVTPPPDLPEDEEDDIQDETENEPALPGSVQELIIKVKKIVRFCKQSEIASTKLRDLQKIEQGKTDGTALRLINEVRTRWNTCYEMCDRYLELAPFVNRVLFDVQRDKGSKAKPPEMLTAEEEDILREVRDLLAPLARATKEVSGDKIMTLSKCIPVLRNIKHEVENYLPTSGIGFNMKEHLLSLIKDYFGNVEETPMFAAATLLDPRFKKQGFCQDLRTPLRLSRAINFVSGLVKEKMAESEVEQAATSIESTTQRQDADDGSFWSAFDRQISQQSFQQCGQDTPGGIPVQLRMYLDRPPVSRQANPDPLRAWQPLKSEYNFVYMVAQEYLSILATSVPAERLFSHAGWIAHQRRTRLAAGRLSKLIFLRSLQDDLWF